MHKPLIATTLMLFFFALFDGINGYAVPLLLLQAGMSKSATGFIMSTSSLAGALFDMFLIRNIKNTNFRRMYLLMFAIAGIYPIVLYNAHSVGIFIIAMGIWGIYFDLLQFANLDFVSRRENKDHHAASFGAMESARAGGYLIAPLIAGFFIVQTVGWAVGLASLVVLAISFLCYLLLRYIVRGAKREKIANYTFHKRGFFVELRLLERVGKHILPIIILAIFLNVHDAFFWTLGPLVTENLSKVHALGGLFLTLYFLPLLIGGWLVGKATKKFGRHKTAYFSVGIGSVALALVMLTSSTVMILVIIFISSLLSALAWPSMRGMLSDAIIESPKTEPEIEGLGDFAGNTGYIIGPALAGFLSESIGDMNTFGILGIIGVVIAAGLYIMSRKKALN